MTSSIGIKTGTWRAIRAEESDSFFVVEMQVLPARLLGGGPCGRGEQEIELVNSRLEVEGSLGIPDGASYFFVPCAFYTDL